MKQTITVRSCAVNQRQDNGRQHRRHSADQLMRGASAVTTAAAAAAANLHAHRTARRARALALIELQRQALNTARTVQGTIVVHDDECRSRGAIASVARKLVSAAGVFDESQVCNVMFVFCIRAVCQLSLTLLRATRNVQKAFG